MTHHLRNIYSSVPKNIISSISKSLLILEVVFHYPCTDTARIEKIIYLFINTYIYVQVTVIKRLGSVTSVLTIRLDHNVKSVDQVFMEML